MDHTVIEYVPFRKDFYVEVPEIANMTKEEVETYRWVCRCVRQLMNCKGHERLWYYVTLYSQRQKCEARKNRTSACHR